MDMTMDISQWLFVRASIEGTCIDWDMRQEKSKLREHPPNTNLVKKFLKNLILTIVMISKNQSLMTIQP